MRPQRVVVTGATGNVGSALVARLVADGHQVVGVCRRLPDRTPYDEVAWSAVDLTSDEDVPRLREAVRDADAVVHLAWGFQPSHRPEHLQELGVGGTRRVAEAVLATGVPHLVHMSSVGAYSQRAGSEPVPESWPTGGVPSSPYSRHKSAAEALLDGLVTAHPQLLVTRLRPGIIGQRDAGSSLLRYAVPGFVPSRLIGHLPVVPLDRRLQVPVVHVVDVVDAVVRVLDAVPGGAFNLAAEEPMTAEMVAQALSARLVDVPARVLRTALDAAWRARLVQLDPGWLDLAYSVPLLATDRARDELGWSPSVSGAEVLADVVDGLVTRQSAPTPVLRPRSLSDTLRQLTRGGPVHRRRET